MVKLIEALKSDRIEHFKAKNKIATSILGVVIAESTKQEKDPDDDTIIKVIKKTIENIQLSLKHQFQSQLAIELDVLRAYLPTQKTETEIREKVSDLIESGIHAIGTINKWFKDNWSNQYDARKLNMIIGEKLNVSKAPNS